jgi:AcrR family transcriptional regulator
MNMPNENPTTYPKGERTRDLIIQAAADLFVSQGYHATSTRQITDRLNMARGSLYVHFRSKDEIFEAVLEKCHPWFQIPECVAVAEGNTIEEFVHDSAQRLLAAWDKHPEYIRLHLIELIEFQGRHLPQLFGNNFEKMTAVLRRLVDERDDLTSIPVPTLSRALLGLFFSYLMSDRFIGFGFDIGMDQTAFEYFTDAYLIGVINKDMKKG